MEKVSRKYVPEKLFFDKRLIARNLRQGIITVDELNSHLDQLEDAEEKSLPIETFPIGHEEEVENEIEGEVSEDSTEETPETESENGM
jgi:hypothetical protein